MSALDHIKSVLSAPGGKHLGDLTFWALADASIDRSTLEAKWNSTGLSPELLPEPPTVEKAFKLAIRETQVGLGDRLLRLAKDDETSLVFAVIHEERHSDGTLTYTQEAKVSLDHASGHASGDVRAHDVVVNVLARFVRHRDTHTADDVRRTITRTLTSLSAVLLRDNGGIWWVPSPHAKIVRKLQAAIESIGSSRFYLLPVHDSVDANRTLADAASKSLQDELAELKVEVEQFMSQPPERTSTLVRRLDTFEALKSRSQLYRDILHVQVKDLDSTLGQLAESVEKLLDAKHAA